VQPRFDFVWLASQSPRRRALLEQVGVRHRLLLPGDDEDPEALEAHHPGERPEDYVQRVTRAKLEAATRRLRQRGDEPAPILCADTTVALGLHILGKPADAAEARSTLQRLSGRTHRVLTAVAVAGVSAEEVQGNAGGTDRSGMTTALSRSRVRMAPLSAGVIDAYIASCEPFGKAGAYAIQGALAGWIAHIEGSHSGIMGLPLFETVQLLHACGVRTQLPS
jgi:septum formation protein